MDLKTRAVNILTKPAAEWPVIAGETTTPGELITTYAGPLAAIPAICTFIGMSVVGLPVVFLGTIRVGIVQGLTNAIVSWVFGLVGVYLSALIIEKLAPTFQSRGDTTQAMKLVVYASTPVWIAGVLYLIPALGPLGIVAGLYAIYLFYLGLPHVMHTPSEKVIPYMAVAAVVSIIVFVIVFACTRAITGVRY